MLFKIIHLGGTCSVKNRLKMTFSFFIENFLCFTNSTLIFISRVNILCVLYLVVKLSLWKTV